MHRAERGNNMDCKSINSLSAPNTRDLERNDLLDMNIIVKTEPNETNLSEVIDESSCGNEINLSKPNKCLNNSSDNQIDRVSPRKVVNNKVTFDNNMAPRKSSAVVIDKDLLTKDCLPSIPIVKRRKSLRGVLVDSDNDKTSQIYRNINPAFKEDVVKNNKARKPVVNKNRTEESNSMTKNYSSNYSASKLSKESDRNSKVINQSTNSKFIESDNQIVTSIENVVTNSKSCRSNSYSIDYNATNYVDKQHPMVNIPRISSSSAANMSEINTNLKENIDGLRRRSKSFLKLDNFTNKKDSNLERMPDSQPIVNFDIETSTSNNNCDSNVTTTADISEITIEKTLADIKDEDISLEDSFAVQTVNTTSELFSPIESSSMITNSSKKRITSTEMSPSLIRFESTVDTSMEQNRNIGNLPSICNDHTYQNSRCLRRATISIDRPLAGNTLSTPKKTDTSLSKKNSNIFKRVLKVRLNRSTVRKYLEKLPLKSPPPPPPPALSNSVEVYNFSSPSITKANKRSKKNLSEKQMNKTNRKKGPKSNAFAIKFGKDFIRSASNIKRSTSKESKTMHFNNSGDNVDGNMDAHIDIKIENEKDDLIDVANTVRKTSTKPQYIIFETNLIDENDHLNVEALGIPQFQTVSSGVISIRSSQDMITSNEQGIPERLASTLTRTDQISRSDTTNKASSLNTTEQFGLKRKEQPFDLSTREEGIRVSTTEEIPSSRPTEQANDYPTCSFNYEVATSTNKSKNTSRKRAAQNDKTGTETRENAPKKPRAPRKSKASSSSKSGKIFENTATQTNIISQSTTATNTDIFCRRDPRDCGELIPDEINFIEGLIVTTIVNSLKVSSDIRKNVIEDIGKTSNLSCNDIEKVTEFLRLYARKIQPFLPEKVLTIDAITKAITTGDLTNMVTSGNVEPTYTNSSNSVNLTPKNSTFHINNIEFQPIFNKENKIVECRPVFVEKNNTSSRNVGVSTAMISKPQSVQLQARQQVAWSISQTKATSTSNPIMTISLETTCPRSAGARLSPKSTTLTVPGLPRRAIVTTSIQKQTTQTTPARSITYNTQNMINPNQIQLPHMLKRGIAIMTNIPPTFTTNHLTNTPSNSSAGVIALNYSMPEQLQVNRTHQGLAANYNNANNSVNSVSNSRKLPAINRNDPRLRHASYLQRPVNSFVNCRNYQPTSTAETQTSQNDDTITSTINISRPLSQATTTNSSAKTVGCHIGKIRVNPYIGGIKHNCQPSGDSVNTVPLADSASTLLGGNSAYLIAASNAPSTFRANNNPTSTQFGNNAGNVLYGNNSANTLLGGNSGHILIGCNPGTNRMSNNSINMQFNGNSASTLLGGNSASTLVEGNSASTLLGGNSASTLVRGNTESTLVGDNSASTVLGGNLPHAAVINRFRPDGGYIGGPPGMYQINGIRSTNPQMRNALNTPAGELFNRNLTNQYYGGNNTVNIADNSMNTRENSASTLLGGNSASTLHKNFSTSRLADGNSASTLLGGNSAHPMLGGNPTSSVIGVNSTNTLLGGIPVSTLCRGSSANNLIGVIPTSTLCRGTTANNLIGGIPVSSLCRGSTANNLIGGIPASTLCRGSTAANNLLGSANTLLGGNSATAAPINRLRSNFDGTLTSTPINGNVTAPFSVENSSRVFNGYNFGRNMEGLNVVPTSYQSVRTLDLTNIPVVSSSAIPHIGSRDASETIGPGISGNTNASKAVTMPQQFQMLWSNNINNNPITLRLPPSLQVGLIEASDTPSTSSSITFKTPSGLINGPNILRKTPKERLNNNSKNKSKAGTSKRSLDGTTNLV